MKSMMLLVLLLMLVGVHALYISPSVCPQFNNSVDPTATMTFINIMKNETGELMPLYFAWSASQYSIQLSVNSYYVTFGALGDYIKTIVVNETCIFPSGKVDILEGATLIYESVNYQGYISMISKDPRLYQNGFCTYDTTLICTHGIISSNDSIIIFFNIMSILIGYVGFILTWNIIINWVFGYSPIRVDILSEKMPYQTHQRIIGSITLAVPIILVSMNGIVIRETSLQVFMPSTFFAWSGLMFLIGIICILLLLGINRYFFPRKYRYYKDLKRENSKWRYWIYYFFYPCIFLVKSITHFLDEDESMVWRIPSIAVKVLITIVYFSYLYVSGSILSQYIFLLLIVIVVVPQSLNITAGFFIIVVSWFIYLYTHVAQPASLVKEILVNELLSKPGIPPKTKITTKNFRKLMAICKIEPSFIIVCAITSLMGLLLFTFLQLNFLDVITPANWIANVTSLAIVGIVPVIFNRLVATLTEFSQLETRNRARFQIRKWLVNKDYMLQESINADAVEDTPLIWSTSSTSTL
eukprot:TRINITY_DN959_c4_g2_i1.p1 TRINITY_DN959_c4_g2~~TRINITY_DN959_c4_g2_i1.p1  ORF type:complete len:526 (+),score=32.40 TRINITY_DN959_c4_g2_i1:1-1578(+)